MSKGDERYKTIDEREVCTWVSRSVISTSEETAISWLTEILNGTYSVESAREDILSFRKEIQALNKDQET